MADEKVHPGHGVALRQEPDGHGGIRMVAVDPRSRFQRSVQGRHASAYHKAPPRVPLLRKRR